MFLILQVPLQAAAFCAVHRQRDVPEGPVLQANSPQPIRYITEVNMERHNTHHNDIHLNDAERNYIQHSNK